MENASSDTVGTGTIPMIKYMGTKEIKARPMTLGEYKVYAGKPIVSGEDPTDSGYLVEYVYSSPNHPNHNGYVTWSPKAEFVMSYQANGSLSFGHAMLALKEGKMVQRKGWNGKGLFVFKQVEAEVSMDIVPKMSSLPQSVKDEFTKRAARRVDRGGTTLEEYSSIRYFNQFCIVYPNNDLFSWVPSANDTCANDWSIL